MKRLVSAVLALTIIISLFAACGCDDSNKNQTKSSTKSEVKKDNPNHTLYFKDSYKSKKAVAHFFNSVTGKSEKVNMKKISEDKDSVTFSCVSDCSKYNMAYITCGKKDKDDNKNTDKFAFNKCTSGWYRTKDELLPYTYGQKIDYSPEFDKATFKYDGLDRTVYIWKPADYDEKSADKYSTVYVLDGQSMAFVGREDQIFNGCPVVTEQVSAMTSETGQKAIVVAIENVHRRDMELVPDIGEQVDDYGIPCESPEGEKFSDWVTGTLVPYVRKNYNVYTDALHTSISGASLGGLESFYIVLEHPEIFGTVGALSPSFWVFKNSTWDTYIKNKCNGKNLPFLYLYTGDKKWDTGAETEAMYNRLIKMNYPKDKLALHYNENGSHNSKFWRAVFSEFLTAMVYRQIEPLQKSK